ncbi:MAG TPA: hypothetical protein VNS60_13380 [Solirubrobacterales bacterium]|nr:hypothetical protein [Solirubrobacterales bacterium]
MFKRLKQRLEASGPGLTVAVIAMVLALTGGAFAAAGKLTGPQKKEVEKIAKKVAKPGKPGAPGPAGKDGTNGTNGAKGDKGDNGTNGTNGTNGKSAVVTPEPEGENCEKGGVAVEVSGEPATKKFVCNGQEGSPWTVDGTLPPEKTETGAWAFTGTTADTNGIRVPISFPIHLSGGLEETAVHFQGESEFGVHCPGIVAVPEADPGQLCVYVNNADEFPVTGTTVVGIFKLDNPEEPGASRAGAILRFVPPTAAAAGGGSFAVTAPLLP